MRKLMILLVPTFLMFMGSASVDAQTLDAAPTAAENADPGDFDASPAPADPVEPGALSGDSGASGDADLENPAGMVVDLYDAARGGNWRVLVIMLLMLSVSAIRWLGGRWKKLGAMLSGESDWPGAMLVFGLSLAGAFATAWRADASFDLSLLQAAWQNAVLAFGGYSVVWKKLLKPKLGFLGAK